MSLNNSPGPPSPVISNLLPIGHRSRRGSTASLVGPMDKAQLHKALDDIHSSASKSEKLTTFNEFAAPPSSSSSAESRGLTGELMQNGLSGLYSRFKGAVAGSKDKTPSPLSKNQADDAEGRISGPRSNNASVVGLETASLKSPAARSSTSSRLLSPAVTVQPAPKEQLEDLQSLSIPPQSISITNRVDIGRTDNTTTASEGGLYLSKSPQRSAGSLSSDEASQLSRQAPLSPAADSSHLGDQVITSDSSEDDSAIKNAKRPSRTLQRDDNEKTFNADGNAEVRARSPVVSRTIAKDESRQTDSPSKNQSAIDRVSTSDEKQSSAARADQRQLPGYRPSGADPSTDDSVAIIGHTGDVAGVGTKALSFSIEERKSNTVAGMRRTPIIHQSPSRAKTVNSRLEQMRKQVLSKEFWMADEICKECFLCGDSFTVVRRKHHCRTCGCIFDSKCTSIIPGEKFGVHGSLRVCKTCLNIINRRNNDSSGSDDSGDEYIPTSFFQAQQVKAELLQQNHRNDPEEEPEESEVRVVHPSRSLATPMMAIPAARYIGDPANRRSAVLEIDAPQLSRPSSSRSVKSMTGARPPSSSHRRHQSKHNLFNKIRGITEQRAPFHNKPGDERKWSVLPAFHDDNIIDPDLAPYMSDEGSSGDEQMSIFGALNGDTMTSPDAHHERSAFGSLLNTARKHRSRAGDRSQTGVSFVNRGMEDGLNSPHSYVRPNRKRNPSTSSNHLGARGSPRHGRPGSSIRNFGDHSEDILGSIDIEPGSSPRKPSMMMRSVSMQNANAPAIELNSASLQHVKKLLRQLLQDAKIPNVTSWEKALLPVLLRSTDDVNPDVRGGDAIDIRHYVKLKKIPGGKPGDTAYISGIVFSKNLALKSMPRSIAHPRIVLISFPIEYAKHQQHFMSIEPVIAQEPDFLRNMVNRIVSLRPQLVLVQRNISGLALQYLTDAGVAVAYNVKKSVMEAVSRFTQTEIISSIDMVALKPVHVGKSAGFDVKTYTHHDIPGKKKTYMQISGCPKELGCTIVLRGASPPVLSKVKRITEFMVYVVYNLKLETCLMRDEFVMIPSVTSDAMAEPRAKQQTDVFISPSVDDRAPNVHEPQADIPGSEKVYGAVDGITSTDATDTQAATVTTVAALTEDHAEVAEHRSIEPQQDVQRHDTDEVTVPDDIPMPTYYSDMVAKHQTKILSASPFVKFMQPYLLMRAREQERRIMYLKTLLDQDKAQEHELGEKEKSQKFQLIQPEMVHTVVKGAGRPILEVLRAVHDAEYDKVMHNYQRQKRQWETYIQGNINLFDPYAHQNIVVLYTVVCTTTTVPCAGPDMVAFGFYNERQESREWYPDCTLGQFVEDLTTSIDDVCDSNGCERKMSDHHRTYVHGEARITIFLERLPCKIKGLQDSILMWSYCKVCQKETQTMPMSESTWKYSFSKYLELSFWSSGLKLRAGFCPHDLHRDHIRYFGYQNVAMRIHYDPIDLLEVIVPRARITWKVDNDLRLKNDLFLKSEERLNRFMGSVKSRIIGINIDSVVPEKVEACREEIERLKQRAHDDHASLLAKLQEKYTESKYYEIVPMNRAVRAMQEKVAEWDAEFADFDANYFPSEKEIRRFAALQLKKMFMDRDTSATSLISADAVEPLSDADTSTLNTEAEDALHAVVEEDNMKESMSSIDEKASPPSTEELQAVGHLDLAIPEKVGRATTVESERLATATDDESNVPTPTQSTLTGETMFNNARPSMVHTASEQSLSEKIIQLRQTNNNASDAEGSNIPKPSDQGTIRKAGMAVSPQLTRTQSQPAGTLQRLPAVSARSYINSSETPIPASEDEHDIPLRPELTKERKLSDRLGLSTLKAARRTGQSLIPRSVQSRRNNSRVSTLAKHFEQLSREFEKERLRDRKQRAAKVTQSRAFPKASSKPIVEVYKDVNEAVQEQGPTEEDLKDIEPEPKNHEQTSMAEDMVEPNQHGGSPSADKEADDVTTEAEAETGDEQPSHSGAASDDEGITSDNEHSLLDDLPSISDIAEGLSATDQSTDVEIPKHEKSSYLKMLTNFWAERSASGWTSLEYPLNATDHVFVDSDVIVREDEPSSLIAFALSSEDYVSKLRAIREQGRSATRAGESQKTSDLDDDFEQAEVEKSLLRATGTHLKYQFAEGSAKMQCKIFYAEQFDAIRRSCGVSERIIESLSRCAKWDSKGGKTKSVFLKTLDDRLVLKSLSQVETQAFLRFAPAYFNLMAEALYHDLPTAIAKMLGFYQIVIKNPVTGTEIKWDLLIMENLFYDRSGCRTFDLKGSMRNRKIQSTGQSDEVLLDENMVEYVYENPLFAREHSKKLLRVSVWNDTLFLARQNVMDYSLMVAVDEARKELVVGVIDCIRTYTWDKKLETWIKDRGFAGGNRNRPTVTSPKEYKSRFREAMGRYILQAPK